MLGRVFEVKRFAVHDGDGIRTTVFFKGCSLKCVWCHNPESLSPKAELAFLEHKCQNCGYCTTICACHKMENQVHVFDKAQCKACGKCVDKCMADALKLYGKDCSVEELMPILLEDKPFYDNSNGGITLSGGECLLQATFCAELLKQCKEKGLHTAVDTCGNVPWKNIEQVLAYTDMFLYDLKAIDEDVHIKCTGMTNKRILENLKRIDAAGKAIEIRVPYVPEYNSSQMEKIAQFVSTLTNVKKVCVLPYHDLARSKYKSLLLPDTMPARLPSNEEMQQAKAQFAEYGIYCT